MKQMTWVMLLLFALLLICGCEKEKEVVTHKVKQKVTKSEEAKKAAEMEMKGMTMESIQREGKVVEVTPALVRITPRMQQLFGVTIGKVEVRPIERVIRTVGRVDYDEKRVMSVSPKIGSWI